MCPCAYTLTQVGSVKYVHALPFVCFSPPLFRVRFRKLSSLRSAFSPLGICLYTLMVFRSVERACVRLCLSSSDSVYVCVGRTLASRAVGAYTCRIHPISARVCSCLPCPCMCMSHTASRTVDAYMCQTCIRQQMYHMPDSAPMCTSATCMCPCMCMSHTGMINITCGPPEPSLVPQVSHTHDTLVTLLSQLSDMRVKDGVVMLLDWEWTHDMAQVRHVCDTQEHTCTCRTRTHTHTHTHTHMNVYTRRGRGVQAQGVDT